MKNFIEQLQAYFEAGYVQKYIETYGEGELKSVILYTWNLSPRPLRQQVIEMFRNYVPRSEDEVKTITDSILFEGYEKGIKKGIEQGIEQGREEGILLGGRRKQLEIAKSMFEEALFSLERIAKIVGLSPAEIKAFVALQEDEIG